MRLRHFRHLHSQRKWPSPTRFTILIVHFPLIPERYLSRTRFLSSMNQRVNESITPPIPPSVPPPLLPRPTVKLALAQLPINLVMGPAHPQPKLLPSTHPRLILRPDHPILEILRAHPARIQLGEEGEELKGFGLQGFRGGCGVVGRHGVQQCPG